MSILVLDNTDSFVWNLARMLRELGEAVSVVRSDALSIEDVRQLQPRAVLLSPGPMGPEEAGISLELIRTLGPTLPIMGVCLGHQCIAVAHGAQIGMAPPVHGHPWAIHHRSEGLLAGLPAPFVSTRYHSLVVLREGLPETLRELAWTERDGQQEHIMAIAHRSLPHLGLQFHPESVASEHGAALLERFLAAADAWHASGHWSLGGVLP